MKESQLFVVRVWSTRPHFRASVRAVGDEQSHVFTEPKRLTEFLIQRFDGSRQPDAFEQTGETR